MKPLVAMALLALAGCDQRPDEWTAFVYPDGADLTEHFEMRGFKSFEQCQQSAINSIRGFERTEPTDERAAADYECGYKCAPDPKLGGINVCKETRK